MFNDLPSRIAGKTNGSGVVTSSDVRVHLELVESLLNTVKEPRIRILSALSLFKLKMPWIYEIGIETLRLVDSDSNKSLKESAVENYNEYVLLALDNILRLNDFPSQTLGDMMKYQMLQEMMVSDMRLYLEDNVTKT